MQSVAVQRRGVDIKSQAGGFPSSSLLGLSAVYLFGMGGGVWALVEGNSPDHGSGRL